MGRLQTNEDGTITIALRGGVSVLLEEPTMDELADIHDLINAADEQLGVLTPLSLDASDEDKAQRRKELVERTAKAFGRESPHGDAMVKIVNMVRSDTAAHAAPYTRADLPGWLCHPTSSLQLLLHFRTPLPGADSNDETE